MTNNNGGYTDDEMSVLTDEERKALGALGALDADEADEARAEQPDTQAQADTGATAGDKAEKDGSTATMPNNGVHGGKDEAGAQQGQTLASPAQTGAFPQFTAPQDADATLADIRGKVDTLDQAFDDGEITAAEHRAQTRALVDAERQIREEMLMAQMSEKARLQAYQNTVQTFLATNPEYEPGSQKYHLLDAELRRRQNEAANAGRDPLEPSLIEQAHGSLTALFSGAPTQPIQSTVSKAQTPQPRRDLPPSIATLPAADMQSVTEGAFSGLARLNGEDFEAAFAKLSDTQREQFLAHAN